MHVMLHFYDNVTSKHKPWGSAVHVQVLTLPCLLMAGWGPLSKHLHNLRATPGRGGCHPSHTSWVTSAASVCSACIEALINCAMSWVTLQHYTTMCHEACKWVNAGVRCNPLDSMLFRRLMACAVMTRVAAFCSIRPRLRRLKVSKCSWLRIEASCNIAAAEGC